MLLSQKCLYGLRAIFEIAKRRSQGVATVAEIAKEQAIPPRYLEVILGTLKGAGLVIALRGKNGGYTLARNPETITVQEIIKLMNGTLTLVDCNSKKSGKKCSLKNRCVFALTWKKAQQAMEEIFFKTTIASLLEQEQQMNMLFAVNYEI